MLVSESVLVLQVYNLPLYIDLGLRLPRELKRIF